MARQLLSVSCFSLLFVIVTAFFYHRRIIRPKLSAWLNLLLAVEWAAGSALLVHYLSPLLGNDCSVVVWKDDAAVMVCQLYKALTAFSVIGLYVLAPASYTLKALVLKDEC
jgi:hypothetical protein